MSNPTERKASPMLYLQDYIERQMSTFDQSPFNPVDAGVFTQVTMIRGMGMIPGLQERMSFANLGTLLLNAITQSQKPVLFQDLLRAEYFDDMFAGHNKEELRQMLFSLAASPRFRDVTIRDYLSLFDTKAETQFAAMSFVYGKEFGVTCFRGTDATMTGWKEDFNMMFSMPVPAQAQAQQYLETVATRLPKRLFICGHSKGGNLAEYAALTAKPELQQRIERVYIFDGPGFKEGTFTSEDYAPIIDRMYKIVPRDSIIGLLLDSPLPLHVVPSSASGFEEHSVFTWQVAEPKTHPDSQDHAGDASTASSDNSAPRSSAPDTDADTPSAAHPAAAEPSATSHSTSPSNAAGTACRIISINPAGTSKTTGMPASGARQDSGKNDSRRTPPSDSSLFSDAPDDAESDLDDMKVESQDEDAIKPAISSVGNDFVYLHDISDSSKFAAQALRNWITPYDDAKRKNMVEALFRIMRSSGSESVSELFSGGPESIGGLIEGMQKSNNSNDVSTVLDAGRDLLTAAASLVMDRLGTTLSHTARTFEQNRTIHAPTSSQAPTGAPSAKDQTDVPRAKHQVDSPSSKDQASTLGTDDQAD